MSESPATTPQAAGSARRAAAVRRPRGGRAEPLRFTVGESALGALLVAAGPRGVRAILLGDTPAALTRAFLRQFPHAERAEGDAEFEEIFARVADFVTVPELGLDLPLDLRGTPFQRRVWQALREIPSGTTVSYRRLAERIGAPASARAVAAACAANLLAVAVPCHRVVRGDVALAGYRGGIDRKRALLEREAAIVSGGQSR